MSKSHLTTKSTKDTKGSDYQNSNFVFFVSFVVKIVFPYWLRLCHSRNRRPDQREAASGTLKIADSAGCQFRIGYERGVTSGLASLSSSPFS